MKEIIVVNPEKCVGCNACVRNCPAQEANITTMREDGTFVTTVNPEKCICCGECVRSCMHGARDYNDDTEAFMNHIKNKEAALLVTPAIKAAHPTLWKPILDWFKRKNVKTYDVSYGADICTWAHLRAIENKDVNNIITQPCAAIVNFIETYEPDLLKNLSPIHSPIMCEAIYLKKYLHLNMPIAVLSPCIAKKTEFERTGYVSYNVTFKKLQEYFTNNNIHMAPMAYSENVEYNFDDQQGQVGAIYSRPGGLRDNIWLHNPDVNITTSEGVHKVYPELRTYAKMPEFKHPEVFDVLSCEFGCNIGPGAGTDQTIFDVMHTMSVVEKSSKQKRKTKFFDATNDKLFKKFDELLSINDFVRTYSPKQVTPQPTMIELEDVFCSMGKTTTESRKYNCHACGYASCMEMATAIYRGLNVPDNCIVHAKSVLHSKHDTVGMMVYKCREFSDNLVQDIDLILKNIQAINNASTVTSEKSTIVRELLTKLVAFCDANKYDINEEVVERIVQMLQTVIGAFKHLDTSISITNESSVRIDNSVSELTRLVEELNVMLHETTDVDKY